MVVQLARKYRVQLPVLTAVAQVLDGHITARQAVYEIMNLPQVGRGSGGARVEVGEGERWPFLCLPYVTVCTCNPPPSSSRSRSGDPTSGSCSLDVTQSAFSITTEHCAQFCRYF